MSACIADLEAEGFKSNPLALSILSSFGGMSLQLPVSKLFHEPRKLVFDPCTEASGEFDRTEDWTNKLGLYFFPIGYLDPVSTIIWVGSDSKFYLGREFGLALLRDSFLEAMDWILHPAEELPIVAD